MENCFLGPESSYGSIEESQGDLPRVVLGVFLKGDRRGEEGGGRGAVRHRSHPLAVGVSGTE